MIKYIFFIFLFFSAASLLAQEKMIPSKDKISNTSLQKTNNPDTTSTSEIQQKATIDQYRVVSIENDTTYIDTTLTIQKEYIYNYLRKDTFGLLPFANEGQTYATLQYKLNAINPFPEFGFQAKHFNYLEANDIKYYSVATPLTELYFKTVMKQGQSLDAFITLNTSERLNFSVAYKGLRSLGNYTNQLSSTGNFRFTTNYTTKNKRYSAKAHFTAQDILNGENGGIINNENFEGEDSNFQDRARLQVYFTDATSLLKGNRYFIDHNFRINKQDASNKLFLTHQINFENKSFNFSQINLATTKTGENTAFKRFGDSYVANNINDKTRYNKLYNKAGILFENAALGQFHFFIDDYNYNYYYNSVIINDDANIPSSLHQRINSVGGQYKYQKNNWNGNFQFAKAISKQSFSNLDLFLQYSIDEQNQIAIQYQNISKLPNLIYNLHQSSYISYNWSNNFDNEKINNIQVQANTKWANATLQLTSLQDKIYFSDDNNNPDILIVTPKQYQNTINYISLKLEKEFKIGKFALDNTVLYQKTEQSQNILNLPQFVTRNTIYYSDHVFKKAMFLQTGFTLNYFTKHNANDYNPLIGEFYVQNQKQIGAFPMVDFFVNAKVRQTRIYVKAEHFNSAITGNNFYTAPNYPYRDFIVRFGLVWNFFQ